MLKDINDDDYKTNEDFKNIELCMLKFLPNGKLIRHFTNPKYLEPFPLNNINLNYRILKVLSDYITDHIARDEAIEEMNKLYIKFVFKSFENAYKDLEEGEYD